MNVKLYSAAVVVLSCTLLIAGCGESGTSEPVPTTGWLAYENAEFGLSFQYPPSLNLLLDEPDASGIQMSDEGLRLGIIVNPATLDTVEAYASHLGREGFAEKRRSVVSKGSWTGLRLEGAGRSDEFEFPEIVYLVKSDDSLLAVNAVWE